jgi:hypothetical protein
MQHVWPFSYEDGTIIWEGSKMALSFDCGVRLFES